MNSTEMTLKIRYFLLFILLSKGLLTFAQKRLPVIKATKETALILDGENVKIDWKLDPGMKPDIYYVNIPRKQGKVTLRTDLDKISFKTKYGEAYDFVVLLNQKDSCFVRFVARETPTPVSLQMNKPYPATIPFTLTGSRIYFKGYLNDGKVVNIQFDLGAGGACVNRLSSEKLRLTFDQKTMVSNTQGVNEARVSSANVLSMAGFTWKGVPLTEVGNMKAEEDLIIGNGPFRDKIIEIDYDKMILIVHERLPEYAKNYKKQEVFFEQDRPKFKAEFIQNAKKYTFWCLFDTGREGTMLIGEDFTGQADHWNGLKELEIINGRKIVRLDAIIGGVVISDIVTNAANPAQPQGRPTLFGNQILNHFNVILDNQKGVIYLKPNSRKDQPYSDYGSYLRQRGK
jgi:hypothetical protein